MSKNNVGSRFARPVAVRIGIVILFLTTLISGVVPAEILADPIVITQTREFRFGVLERNEVEKNVDFTDNAAGQFSLSGDVGKSVRITIIPVPLTSVNASMELNLTASNIAYSRDGGVTWKTFSNANLVQETQFPTSPGNTTSMIMVRIGGRLSIAQNQRRGSYQASLTVMASYIE